MRAVNVRTEVEIILCVVLCTSHFEDFGFPSANIEQPLRDLSNRVSLKGTNCCDEGIELGHRR